jgi:flavin reductase (DIM6/NTAB) family NADH-FMN oxidoreductase RutF
VDTTEFDRFVEGLDYPMFVVTTAHEGRRAGCLVGFATQASIDPPRMLVCLSTTNHTYRLARGAGLLAVHVLDPAQEDLADLFGGVTGDDVDKFARCRWIAGPNGVPLLEDCPRKLVGRVLEQHPYGDHVGFLLDPVDLEVNGTGAGLSFDQVEDLEPGHQP